MDKLLAPNILCRRRRHLLAALLGGASGAVLTPPFAASAAPESLPVLGVMPELVGLTDWFNGSPLSRQQLMGKVVVVEFWALGCINCRHALPHVAAWYERYKDQGLVVVGVHAPEFDAERPVQAVRQAAADMKLGFPIALDNDFRTWNAFRNAYWPAAYFVDAQGRIRHRRYGEGAYEQGERVIQALLSERHGQGAPIKGAWVDGGGMHVAEDRRKTVLLVEDDPHIADIAYLHLVDEGFAVTQVQDGRAALELLDRSPWDALVLDLMLPGVDGLEVCRKARSLAGYTPIIMISARSSEVHRILGLELGADDYLPKPFSMLELVARVRALLRRVDALSKAQPGDGARFAVGALTIDAITRDVRLGGQALELTPKEFDLLCFFAKHPGKVYSRLDLLNQVWGYEHDGYEHTVNTHINRLRAKIERDPAKPQRIVTVWGVGYKLTPEKFSQD